MESIDMFFSLLRSGMYGTPVPECDLPEQIDWKSIVKLARKHAVLGVIIDGISLLPARLRPEGPLADKLNKFALGLIQTNLLLDNAVGRLVSFFSSHGINGVLLKGQGVARSYYRNPQTRHSGDIDFYVGRRVYKEAVALCKQHLSEDPAENGETEKHFGFYMSGIWIELHRMASTIYSPLRNRRFQQWTVEQLEHSDSRRTLTLGDTVVTLPSYDFDAIFIFYHAWRHFIMGGIGLRQLCDWALIFHTHASEIDTDRLTDNIRRFGLTEGWKLFASIAVRHLGLDPAKMPLYDPSYAEKSEKVLADILDGGNFGYYSKANKRTPVNGKGLRHRLGQVRNVTGYFLTFFPIIPVEATLLYFNRLYTGVKSAAKRSAHHTDN